MHVTIFGIGYVGLVQAAVLSEVGHNVCCVDVDAKKIEELKQGIIPIYEPGLTALVKTNYEAGHITFTSNAEEGVNFTDIQFIAVGTPPDSESNNIEHHHNQSSMTPFGYVVVVLVKFKVADKRQFVTKVVIDSEGLFESI